MIARWDELYEFVGYWVSDRYESAKSDTYWVRWRRPFVAELVRLGTTFTSTYSTRSGTLWKVIKPSVDPKTHIYG